MRKIILGSIVATLLVAWLGWSGSAPAARTATTRPAADIHVYFSPGGGCTAAVVAALASAKQSIDIQAYSFTSTAIAKAVHEAHDRGVAVRVILDKSQRTEKYSAATYLLDSGVPTWIDAKHAIAHNKIMLIDGRTIITGSFNFTKAAEESNAENMLVIHDQPDLFAQYASNFSAHLGHSEKYTGKQ